MRSGTTSILKYLLGGAALFAGYEIYQHSRPVGQRAQVGDQAFVDVSKLPAGALPVAITSQIPPGSLLVITIGSVDNAAGTIAGTVAGFATTTPGPNGPVTTVQNLPLPGPAFPGNIPRTAITAVRRGGSMLT